jgi:CMP-N-acetylneuraminic acid synthetase
MKVAALLIGKETSLGLPGKNYMQLLARPLCVYPLLAAKHCSAIEMTFVSTDSPTLENLAALHGADIIVRPKDLGLSTTPTESVFVHGYEEIRRRVGALDYLFLMFANSADVLPQLLLDALALLRVRPDLDAVISVSKYNMFSPLRARRVDDKGRTTSMISELNIHAESTFDRDVMGDIYFADFGVQVVRPERCLVDVESGSLPFKWLGQHQGAIVKEFGFDIDSMWQVPVIEYWLRGHGFTESQTPYDC